MNLTLASEELSRSLERRWLLEDSEPVASRLPPYKTFVPTDVRIWWQAEDGQPTEEHTLHASAWPAERESTVFADWRDERKMPAWARELSAAVRTDLLTNTASANTGVEDRWAHGLKRRWTLEDAPPLEVSRYNRESFVPVELDMWWSVNVGLPTSENRYSIYAWSAGRDGRRSSEKTAQWSGSRASFTYGYDDCLPGWIRELAEAQYGQLNAIATAHTIERESRP